MAIPQEIILEIKYRNDIEVVISPYVNLKRRGKNLVGLCPFHNEKTPSFTVYPENGSFYCYGCGVGGDCFTFTRLIENLDYIEAVKLLAERSGITLPQDGFDDSYHRLKQKILDINRETARFFHNYLISKAGKWALDYLVGRGLSVATIKRFGLGAAPSGWTGLRDHLVSIGFSDWELQQANVVSKSSSGRYYDRFRDRVMFPVIDLRGNVIAFSGRARPGADDTAKYINSSDTPVYKKSSNLFGINFAKSKCSDRIILVEGNMDVVSLHQAGFENTVAPLGTSFTAEQAKLISRYTKEIVLTLDSDLAGQKAVLRAIEILKNCGIDIKVMVLPDSKDPDEFIKKFGSARFQKLLDEAVSCTEYLLLRSADGINTSSDEGRLKFLQRAAASLAQNANAITVDYYAGKLSEKYGVTKSTIIDEVNKIRKTNLKSRQKKEIENIITPRYTRDDINSERIGNIKAVSAEETFLAVLLNHPNLFESAYKRLKPDDLVTTLNKRVYRALSDILSDGASTVDIALLGENFSPSEMGYIASLQNGVNGQNNAETVLNDCILVILKEGMLKSAEKDENLSMNEWENKINNMINSKKGE